jgi:hypothetical protein
MARLSGSVRAARVDRWYMDADLDIPVADLTDAYGGVYRQCKIVSAGEGDSWSFDYAPPPISDSSKSLEESGEVLIAFLEGRSAHPVILGTLYVADAMKHDVLSEQQDSGDNVDYGDKHHIYDRVIKHKGVRCVFASSGTWLLDMTLTKKPARIQLDEESFVRISMNGQADEYVLLANAFLEHTRAVHARIDELAEKMKAYADALSAKIDASNEAWKVPDDAFAAAVDGLTSTTLLATMMEGVATAQGLIDAAYSASDANIDPTLEATNNIPLNFSYSVPLGELDGGSDELKAACFRISARSIKDQGGE